MRAYCLPCLPCFCLHPTHAGTVSSLCGPGCSATCGACRRSRGRVVEAGRVGAGGKGAFGMRPTQVPTHCCSPPSCAAPNLPLHPLPPTPRAPLPPSSRAPLAPSLCTHCRPPSGTAPLLQRGIEDPVVGVPGVINFVSSFQAVSAMVLTGSWGQLRGSWRAEFRWAGRVASQPHVASGSAASREDGGAAQSAAAHALPARVPTRRPQTFHHRCLRAPCNFRLMRGPSGWTACWRRWVAVFPVGRQMQSAPMKKKLAFVA